MLETDYIDSLYQSFCSLHLSTYSLPDQYNLLITAFTNNITKINSNEEFLDETKTIINQTMINVLIQLMCVNGYIKSDQKYILYQTFALNSIQFFIEQIGFFVSGIYDYVHDLKTKLLMIINTKDKEKLTNLNNEFIKSGVFLLKNINPLNVLSNFVDVIAKQNAGLIDLPSINSKIIKLTKLIKNTVVSSDEFRKAIEEGEDFSKQKAMFLKTAKSLKKKSSKIYNFLVDKHKTIGTYFVPFSQNQKIIDFISYVSHYVHSISCISFMTIIAGSLAPKKSHSCLSLMNQISEQSLIFITSIQKLLNCHCDPNEEGPKIIKMSRDLIEFFKSVSNDVSVLISLGSETFKNIYYNKLMSLFSELIETSNIFKDKYNELISELNFKVETIDCDSICNIENPMTEISKKPIEILLVIMKSLLGLEVSSFAHIVTLIKYLSSEYELLIQKMNQIIKSEPLFNNRIKIVHQKAVITRAMKDFVKYFGEFNKNKEDELKQIQTSLTTFRFLLGICTIDTMSIQFPILDELNEVLTKLTKRFYLNHESKIKFLIDSIKEKSEQLPEEVRSNTILVINHLNDNVFPFCDSAFTEHRDLTPTSINFYIQAYQNLSLGLMELMSAIKSKSLEQYYVEILLNIEKYQNICYSLSDLYPLLVNLYSYHLSSFICKLPERIKKFIQGIQTKIQEKSINNVMNSFENFKASTQPLSNYLLSIKDQIACFSSIIPEIFEKTKVVIPKLNELLVNIRKFSIGSYLEDTIEQRLYKIYSFLLKFEAYNKYCKIDEKYKMNTSINVLLPLIEDHLIFIHNLSIAYINSLTADSGNADLNGLVFALAIYNYCQNIEQYCQDYPALSSQIEVLKSFTNKILEQSAAISLGDLLYQKQAVETNKQIQQNYENIKLNIKNIKDNNLQKDKTNYNLTIKKQLPKLEKFTFDKAYKNSKQYKTKISPSLPNPILQSKVLASSKNEESENKKLQNENQESDFYNILELASDDIEPMEFTINSTSNIFNSVFLEQPLNISHIPLSSFSFEQPKLPSLKETNKLNEKLHLNNNILAQLRIKSDKLKIDLQKLRQNQNDQNIVKDILNIENDFQIIIMDLENELKNNNN